MFHPKITSFNIDNINYTETEESSSTDYNEYLPDENSKGRFGKTRSQCVTYPNHEQGPNINLQILKRQFSTQEEKNFFLYKLQKMKKTELCKNWEIYHDCYYKKECCFAHGIEELRQVISLPSYKTRECKAFQETSFCPFGSRCNYRHVFM